MLRLLQLPEQLREFGLAGREVCNSCPIIDRIAAAALQVVGQLRASGIFSTEILQDLL